MKNPMIEHDCQLATLYLDRVFDYIGTYSTLDLNDREVIDRLIGECKAIVQNYESETSPW
jgi:hypothetical protein